MTDSHFDSLTGLSLSMLEAKHTSDVYNLVCSNREHLRAWLPWVDGVVSIEDTSAFITGTIEQNEKGKGSQYLIEYFGIAAGVIGFQPIDWRKRNVQIGYWLGREFTGKGLVTGSVKRVLEVGFHELELNKIEIRCATRNLSSRAVAERLGMVYEGTLREEEWLYDHFVDHAVYSILRSEYKPGAKVTGNRNEIGK